ncbi:hypothetical protein O7632_20440 [Solwaraspora sp. WMMD406]|uniref:hypothetical protein n=1 Tax=Solwaraspora sp. WMMD406 TaxID=3016095 RepID=UPI002415E8EF|nr:hypothetical protein [Solwaraspora sp. WMMD406]MDG4766450.1 hypothetical protein [Solwaraspora sp. WMMD406]
MTGAIPGHEMSSEPEADLQDEPDPESLWLDPQVGAELYGDGLSASYSGLRIGGVGAVGMGNTIKIVYNLGRPSGRPVITDLVGVTDLLTVYVPTAADDELARKLSERSAVCLAGRPDTGRFSTALVALARRHGPDQTHEILLPDDVEPGVLTQASDRTLKKDHGYVLRLPGDTHSRVIPMLADLFRRREASLLLIRDDEGRVGGRSGAEVTHHPPEPVAVFHAHLHRHLRAMPRSSEPDREHAVSRYLQHEKLTAALHSCYGPQEVVFIAEAVWAAHPAGSEDIERILDNSQPRRRVRAAEILATNQDGTGHRRQRRIDQHERAFRIAYAVFARRPLHYVFEAASLLLEEIDGQAKRVDWGRMALQYSVSELLGPLLQVDWQESRDATNSPGGSSRSAWLRDGAMRGAIIEVAWHEFDSTRPALINWLNTLATRGDEPMQRAAAEAAGLLAHHDFLRVCTELVDEWAASPKRRLRQAAAWTMVAADMGGQVGHLVRRRVRSWAGGRRNYQRDAAARVYASGLRQPDVSWSLADLRRIAQDPMQQHTRTVAKGVRQIYTVHSAEHIIGELVNWSQDRQLQPHAAYALIEVAEHVDDDSRGDVPDLLIRFAAQQIDGGGLVRLWRLALLSPGLSQRAWHTFGQWLARADADDTVRKAVASLVADLAADPSLHRRMEFNLAQLPRFDSGLPRWLDVAMRK